MVAEADSDPVAAAEQDDGQECRSGGLISPADHRSVSLYVVEASIMSAASRKDGRVPVGPVPRAGGVQNLYGWGHHPFRVSQRIGLFV
jgi:hypothetical protein